MDPPTVQLSLLVPRNLVKTLKDALGKQCRLDKSTKIKANTMASPARRPADISTLSQSQGSRDTTTETEQDTYVVPTALSVRYDATPDELKRVKTGLLKEMGMALHEDAVHVTFTNITNTTTPTTNAPSQPKPNALTAPIHAWLTHDLPSTLLELLQISISTLLDAFPTRYTIYPPLLLLPSNTFTTPPWPTLLASLSPSQLEPLYARLCAGLKVTHIAINAPIPAHVLSPSPSAPHSNHSSTPNHPARNSDRKTPTSTENILRAPTGFRPLYGAFGPSPSQPHNPPTPADFAAALWVSTRQNAIYQTWAPLHTMFSRGNVSEKARVLRFASVPLPTTCSEEQQEQERQQERRRWGGKCTAVDLYAGIGYFVFSYAKSEGVARVLGWEVSGWSVEGLRRGARGNGWGVRVVVGGEGDDGEEVERSGSDGWEDGVEKIVVFREDNLNALRRIGGMRERLPPVRHVNCGLLPTSRASWEVAVGVLDPVEGGWIHAHENIAVKDIESTKDGIVERFRKLVNDDKRKVECQHLERVKTYAPGVMHCVLDIYIPPAPSLTAAATSTATSPPPSAPAPADYNTVQSTSADNAR